MDIDLAFVSHYNSYHPEASDTIEVLRYTKDLSKIPLVPNEADYALLVGTLPLFHGHETQLYRELHRVLKPGGMIGVTTQISDRLFFKGLTEDSVTAAQNPNKIAQGLHKNGFDIWTVEQMDDSSVPTSPHYVIAQKPRS